MISSCRFLVVLFALLLMARPEVTVASGDRPGFFGRVTDMSRRPVAGAIVSARLRAQARTTSVYTRSDGRFAFPALVDGEYDLRARRYGFKDETVMARPIADREIELMLEAESDEYDRLATLPSNRWLALPLAEMPTAKMREEFVRECTFCHQQGNWATRVERDPEEWDKVLRLMARMGGILSPETRAALPGILNAAYAPETAVAKLREQVERHPLPNPAGLTAVIDEWEVGDRASVQHDITVDAKNGIVWSVDTTKDLLYRLDPASGERRSYEIPDGGLPIGGIFASAGNVLPPNADARVAPHSLQIAADGRIWVTLCLGNKIGIFDPETESWRMIDQPHGLYPHTLRFDQKGRAWYTLAVSNHVSMIDPSTGEHRTFRLPARTWVQAVAVRLAPILIRLADWIPAPETAPEGSLIPVPYGIDVAPDGSVWFSQLNVHRIGRIDPETFAIELFDTPFPAPRRLRFDSKGKLWVPSFSAGLLARFDPETREFKTWDLPIEPLGSETPYALNVDRKTDRVWICGTNSDTLLRFDPATEQFVVFPLPSRVTYTREIDFDEEGGVWTSNSNTPGWHIESDNPHVVRLRERGAPRWQEADASLPAS